MFGLGEEPAFRVREGKKRPYTQHRMETRRTKKIPGFSGETFINSIGQGYVATTPVQMAVMMNAVSNGGKFTSPP